MEALVIVAHGSHLNAGSSAPTFDHADTVRATGAFDEVREGFWKEEPSFREVLRTVESDEVYVVPLFISEGYFTEEVIPRELRLDDWDPEAWAETVEEYGATKAGMVPTMWRAVLDLDLDEYDLSSLREISFVGEKMSRTTLNRLREEVCANVSNNYASTELMVSTMPVEEMEGDRIDSVGKPWHGTRVRIIEPDGDPSDRRAANEVGEIIIKAADSPVWAWGNTEKAHEEFTDGWWYSGDMGYKDEDGYLFLEGRKDFMIKSKGVKVFPSPIEGVLNEQAGVEEAVVIGVDDEEYGEKVTAVVKRSDPAVTAEDLDEACLESDAIARFERPREYRFVDFDIPRTPSQKLDRKGTAERLAGDE